jgi:flagellar hook protein FlgE
MYTDAVSGMRVSMTRHDIGAHDIANVHTPGYGPYTPHQAETAPSGVRIAHIEKHTGAPPPRSGTDLAHEQVEQITNARTLSFNAAAVKTQDAMTGTLLDMVG